MAAHRGDGFPADWPPDTKRDQASPSNASYILLQTLLGSGLSQYSSACVAMVGHMIHDDTCDQEVLLMSVLRQTRRGVIHMYWQCCMWKVQPLLTSVVHPCWHEALCVQLVAL